jgi:large subunit ribosomal protein L21
MYAIVEIAGQQFKGKDLKVYVHRLTKKELQSFDKVYLLDDNGVITIGPS